MFDAAHARGFPRGGFEEALTAGRYILELFSFFTVVLIGREDESGSYLGYLLPGLPLCVCVGLGLSDL